MATKKAIAKTKKELEEVILIHEKQIEDAKNLLRIFERAETAKENQKYLGKYFVEKYAKSRTFYGAIGIAENGDVTCMRLFLADEQYSLGDTLHGIGFTTLSSIQLEGNARIEISKEEFMSAYQKINFSIIQNLPK